MRAALTYGPRDTRVASIPDPVAGLGEVKVKVAYCGICGSDAEIYEGTLGLLKAPWWPEPPFQTGHEVSGTIEELGPGLQGDYRVGQRVAMNFRKYCGCCRYCRNKMEQFCRYARSYEAGFAELSVYHESCLYPLPEDVSLEQGALLEPLTIAMHAVDLGNVFPGKSVAVLGAGTIGLLVVQLARHAGATRILVSEPLGEKRQVARRLGADCTVDPSEGDPTCGSAELVDAQGFDTVFECSGSASALSQSFALAGICGTVVLVGAYHEDAVFPLKPFHMFEKELTVRSSMLAPYVYERSLRLLSLLDLDSLITRITPLEDIALALASRNGSSDVKVLIKP